MCNFRWNFQLISRENSSNESLNSVDNYLRGLCNFIIKIEKNYSHKHQRIRSKNRKEKTKTVKYCKVPERIIWVFVVPLRLLFAPMVWKILLWPPSPNAFSVAAQRDSKWLKPAKNKFTWCDFTNFSKSISADLHHFRFRWLHALHIQNMSNCFKHNHDQSFSGIYHIIFWRVFVIWNLCAWPPPPCSCPLPHSCCWHPRHQPRQ